MDPVVVGITGASGAVLGIRLVEALLQVQVPVELVISEGGFLSLAAEMGSQWKEEDYIATYFAAKSTTQFRLYNSKNLAAAIASGSYLTKAMVIVPCSMTTLSACAVGFGDTLLRRAAQVAIKEGRPLLIVPRETPISPIHLEHLYKLSQIGVKVVLPVPGWYAKPKTIEDVEWFIVGKILDGLAIPHDLYTRWS